MSYLPPPPKKIVSAYFIVDTEPKIVYGLLKICINIVKFDKTLIQLPFYETVLEKLPRNVQVVLPQIQQT